MTLEVGVQEEKRNEGVGEFSRLIKSVNMRNENTFLIASLKTPMVLFYRNSSLVKETERSCFIM